MATNQALLDLQRKISESARKGKEPPAADALDEDALPCGKEPSANKIGLKICATCGKPPTSLVGTRHENFMPNGAFLFRDELSAKEYYISGMCQACQDSVFNSEEE